MSKVTKQGSDPSIARVQSTSSIKRTNSLSTVLVADAATPLHSAVKKARKEELEDLTKETNFSLAELEEIYSEFAERSAETDDCVNRPTFHSIMKKFGVKERALADRIFTVFDLDRNGVLDVKEFTTGLSAFLRGSPQEKLKFCFQIYDVNGDGVVTRDEILEILRAHCTATSQESQFITDMLFKKVDTGNKGAITSAQFEEGCKKDPLMLEFLSKCLP